MMNKICKTDIAAELAVQEELVSVGGALQVAIGMRAMQDGADPTDAFWSTAFNLGVREFPTKWGNASIGWSDTNVTFNPLKHEDMNGGLLPEDKAKVLRSGWSFGNSILLRAQVESV